ncbi:Probable polygalacturonase At3g15720 [Linum grandiflorum]
MEQENTQIFIQLSPSKAFLKAWKDACGAEVAGGGVLSIPTLVVPKRSKDDGEFLVNPVVFRGPCNSQRLHFQMGGKIVAPNKTEAWGNNREAWIGFVNVDGLSLNGGGSFDGRGLIWWDLCKALFFNNCNRLRVSKLSHLNSPRNHIGIASSSNVKLSGLHISAPADSPNTDGIDISGSTNVYVADSFIGTGDDCIAINGFCSYVTITGVVCGPGHGISVGSLGEDGAYQTVSDVLVKDCVFNRTLNGARIKTWKIRFERITLIDSGNPIIINQDYVNNSSLGPPPSNIQISEVSYDGVRGTSSEGRSIYFNCEEGSSGMGCTDILVNNVHINAATPDVERPYAVCINAHGNYNSSFPAVPCLSPL